ncbi:MAG TPA: M28 family peptidase [Bacteroidales bacterium]
MLFAWNVSWSQDLKYAHHEVKLLTSSSFHGRGYVKNGDQTAARHLLTEFTKFNLKIFGESYAQFYDFQINVFPSVMRVQINGKNLVPGKDFLVYPYATGTKGTFSIETFDSSLFIPGFRVIDLMKNDYSNKFILVDTVGWMKDSFRRNVFDMMSMNLLRSKGFILVTDGKLVHGVSQFTLNFCPIVIKRSSIAGNPSLIKVDIRNKEIDHKAENIIGYIPGSIDTFLVLTAHYDHLGMMGKSTYFPGANDNASGTAMVLNFAKSYATAHPKYSIAFLLFSGEEAGLLGSRYYTEHPLFSLSKIKMLINLDMVGSGAEGVTIFNGSTYPKEFQKLDSLDKAMNLNITLKSKGISKGSDHYLFHLKKVPVLFINTNDKRVGYHDINDTYESLPFTVYINLFKLIDAYLKTF